jgi:uncharacterized OB-fold protein
VTSQQRPLPVEDDDSRPYWEAARAGRLELPRCDCCGNFCYPPRSRCPRCLSTALTWTRLSGAGKVYSFCVVYQAPIEALQVPYVIGQIELQEQQGLRLIANVVGCRPDEVTVDMPVAVEFEALDADHVLPQFHPINAQ